MADMLLTGRWVVLSPTDVLEHHAVVLSNGRVLEVGPTDALRARYHGVPEYGDDNCAVLPGLINAHHHCYGVELANQNFQDDFLEPWMFCGPSMVGLSPYVSSAHAGLRLIRTGVTSVVDMCSAGVSLNEGVARLEEKAQAYRDVGLRAAIAPGERWQNRMVHGAGEEKGFLESLPQDLRDALRTCETQRKRLPEQDYLSLMQALVPSGDGMQQFWFGPTGPQWTPEPVLEQIARDAERLDTRIQTHALESFYEGLESQRIHGKRLMRRFSDMGLLNERLSMAHVVWAGLDDMVDIAASGAQVSHNPGSNLRLRSGVSPAAEMHAHGVSLALGMDGTTLGGDEDMFAEMRLARALNTPPHATAVQLASRDVFSMATIGGARLMGRPHELGQLKPGFCADAVVVDLSRAMAPWCAPEVDPIDLIVGRAKADDIRHVVVQGEVVLDSGQAVKVDAPNLIDRLQREIEANPPDPSSRELAQDLRPYLLAWYARWEHPSLNGSQSISGLPVPEPVLRYGNSSI
ncbi:amidohydrolase family protein [uncultured Ruegeria sp.]|uniref:amidohydrolase family protein n=1 Tax=uncultured Ruegeria sp. TaxID=259304 RepID=UPI0026338D51|nr:amidohydrolase family protein [uncultured Ruegeria sp.]